MCFWEASPEAAADAPGRYFIVFLASRGAPARDFIVVLASRGAPIRYFIMVLASRGAQECAGQLFYSGFSVSYTHLTLPTTPYV